MVPDTKKDNQMNSFTAALILTKQLRQKFIQLATQLVPSLVPEHVNSSTTTMVKCLKDKQ